MSARERELGELPSPIWSLLGRKVRQGLLVFPLPIVIPIVIVVLIVPVIAPFPRLTPRFSDQIYPHLL